MAYDLGAVVPLHTTVRDETGAPADAGAMTLTVTLPDGSATDTPVSSSSAGVYDHAYATVQAGRHVVRWVATGANAGASVDVFDVRAADPPRLFSLAAAKGKLDIPLTSTRDDEELIETIEATTAAVEYFVGAVARRSVTQVVSGGGAAALLHTTPVLDVTGLAGVLPTQVAVPLDVLDTDGDTGVLRRTDGQGFPPGEYRVTYTAGRAAVPANISLAAKLIMQHLWRTNYGASRGLAAIGGGDDYAVTEPIPGLGYAIPNRALQLLQGDRQPEGFA